MPDVTAADPGAGGYVRESPIAIVPVEYVRAEIGDKKIGFAVIVEIGGHAAEPPALARYLGLFGDICESAVAVIAKQVILMFTRRYFALQFLDGRPVHQVKVHEAVVVVIEPARAAAVDLENVVFLATAGNDDRRHAGLFRHITEMDRGLVGNKRAQHDGAAHHKQEGGWKQPH